MAYQECALYGNLVRYLWDRCAERLAELDPASEAETARAWLDDLIRDWFFTPQHDLYGDTRRDVIWREQKGEANGFLASSRSTPASGCAAGLMR